MPLPQPRQQQTQGEVLMSKASATAPRPNLNQIVTDRIIQNLKAGVIPWEEPWQRPHSSGGPFSRNFLTGKPYRGVNVLLLWSSPYASPFWLTFKQAPGLKGTVRKGEKGTQIAFYKQLRSLKEGETASGAEKERAPFVL
jgi:antirestriction protein ArdC